MRYENVGIPGGGEHDELRPPTDMPKLSNEIERIVSINTRAMQLAPGKERSAMDKKALEHARLVLQSPLMDELVRTQRVFPGVEDMSHLTKVRLFQVFASLHRAPGSLQATELRALTGLPEKGPLIYEK